MFVNCAPVFTQATITCFGWTKTSCHRRRVINLFLVADPPSDLRMALHVPRAPGFASMMKDGARFFSGLEEAVIRNIGACKEFAETVQTCYGPNGMNKMVINHLEKLFVTNDAATIIRELEVEHPAAKLMILGSQMQESEVGDATNFVIIFCGALLRQSEELLR